MRSASRICKTQQHPTHKRKQTDSLALPIIIHLGARAALISPMAQATPGSSTTHGRQAAGLQTFQQTSATSCSCHGPVERPLLLAGGQPAHRNLAPPSWAKVRLQIMRSSIAQRPGLAAVVAAAQQDGDYSQPNSHLTSPAGPYGQQQQPAYASVPNSNQQYGSYGAYGSGGTAATTLGGSSSGALPSGWGWLANAASDAGSNSIIGSYNGTSSTSGQHGRYSMQMQQMMAQQQQQQQQMYETSSIGSRNSSANIRIAHNAMDAGSRDGGMQYDVQQGACWSPRAGSAAGSACNAFDMPDAAARGSRTVSSSGYAPANSSWPQGYQANIPAPGSLEAAAAGRGKRDSCSTAGAAGYGSSVPKPVGMAAFSSSKGAFGGKTIVQPPGGRTSFNIFGGS